MQSPLFTDMIDMLDFEGLITVDSGDYLPKSSIFDYDRIRN